MPEKRPRWDRDDDDDDDDDNDDDDDDDVIERGLPRSPGRCVRRRNSFRNVPRGRCASIRKTITRNSAWSESSDVGAMKFLSRCRNARPSSRASGENRRETGSTSIGFFNPGDVWMIQWQFGFPQ